MLNLNRILIKCAMLISFLGTSTMISLVLFSTEHELSIQDRFFTWNTWLLLLAAVFTLFFSDKRPKLGVIDVLVLLLGILFASNYWFITPVNADGKWINFVLLGVMYLSLRMIFSSYKKAPAFVVIVIVSCGLIETLCGISQFVGLRDSSHSLYRMTGTFFNPGPYGGYLSIIMTISIAYVMRYNSWVAYYTKYLKPIQWLKQPVMVTYYLCCTTFILSFIIFFAIMSRAAILAFAVSLVLILMTNCSVCKNVNTFLAKSRTRTLFLVLVSICAIGLFAYYAYSIKKDSADGRVFMWRNAGFIISEHPFFGVGIGAYSSNYAKVQADYFVANPSSDYVNVAGAPEYGFNEYLQVGAEFGIFGMSLMLAIFLIAVYKLIRERNVFGYGLITLMIFAFFSYPLSLLPFQILVTVFIGLAGSLANSQGNTIKWKIVAITISSVLLLIAVYYGNIFNHKIRAVKQWTDIQRFYRDEHYEEAVKGYENLYCYLNDNPRFLFEYGHALNKIKQYNASNLILDEGMKLSSDPMFMNIIGNNYKSLGLYDNAEKSYILAYHILPNRMYPLYLLMKLYEDSSQVAKAINVANMIIVFDSKVESSATKEMTEEAKLLLKIK